MLWGDFCLYLMDAGVGNNLILLQFKKFGASNTLIAIVKTSVVELLILVMCPIVSTWSDRHRSRLGRRIPFMLYATPPLALFLMLVGLSPEIAMRIKSISPHFLNGVSLAGLTIALLTVTYAGYKFCDIFPQSVYYYLWADVIPPQVMGTFTCLFRVFSTLGVLVFNKYLLKYCDDNPAAICIGAAGLYLISFLLLCAQVKEGQYPTPPPAPRDRVFPAPSNTSNASSASASPTHSTGSITSASCASMLASSLSGTSSSFTPKTSNSTWPPTATSWPFKISCKW